MQDGGVFFNPKRKRADLTPLLCLVLAIGLTLAMINIVNIKYRIKSGGKQKELSGNEIYTRCIKDAVQIDVYYGGDQDNSATGFIWSKKDDRVYIMTNYHVVKDDPETNYTYNITFSNDEKAVGTLAYISEENDMAVLDVNKKDLSEKLFSELKPIETGDSDSAMEGDNIYVIGNALGYGQSITDGIISAKGREINLGTSVKSYIQLTAPVNDGNSGGILLDSRGLMIGMITGKIDESASDGIAFAIPVNKIKEQEKNMKKAEPPRDNSGILDDIVLLDTSRDQEVNGLPEGVMVRSISEKNKLAVSGIQKNDIITAFNGEPITMQKILRQKLKSAKKGYAVTVKRAGEDGAYTDVTVNVE